MGYQAGLSQVSGNNSTFVGALSGLYSTGAYNVFVGVQAGNGASGTTTGTNNTFVGTSSGTSNTSGSGNVALGASSLQSNTTASNNTAVGYQAGYTNSIGTLTAFGALALYSNTTGTDNVGLGVQAGKSNSTGSNNISIGTNSGLYQTGSNNIAIGGATLFGSSGSSTGSYNTAVGVNALLSNTTASQNTAVGYQALYTNQTSNANTAVGYQAGYSSNGVVGNVFIGNLTGYSSTGANSTFVGDESGYRSSGASNTFIGQGAGYYVTTGAYNTILGSYSGNQGGLDIRTSSNYIVLSDGAGNPRFYCDNNAVFRNGTSYGSGVNNWNWNGDIFWYGGDAGGYNSANAPFKIVKISLTNRSINAAGTINASGADYAEYMTKAGDFTINKGDICGIDANGKLTNVFVDAISFVVKSTNPSYVGGDNWGHKSTEKNAEEYTAEELEVERQKVDRIAFSGQVPVNVTGAKVGQYIVPINNNGAISGQAVDESAITLQQYMQAVGKVIAIEQDGRAKIIVKVA